MIELQPLASRAAMAGIAHERAPAPIALPYSALDCGGDMPGVARRGCGLARPRLRSRRKLAFLELADERVERPVQHLDDVARRNLMAEQVLRSAQLVMHAFTHRELQRVALGRQRLHFRTLLDWGR